MFGNSKGFTLLETVVAISVLGLGLTIIIGLQTSYVDSYFEENMQARAAFYARYIMTMVEIDEEIPDPGVYTDSLRDRLRDLGYFDFEPDDVSMDEEEFLGKNWQTETEVESISLPFGPEGIVDDALRKVTVKVTWGEGKEFRIEYFRVNDEAMDALG